MAVIEYSSQLLLGANKVGTLKKLDNNYRQVILGGLNVENFSGHYYALDRNVRSIFEDKNSALWRRINSRALRGENGHPRRAPGMSREAWFARLRDIVEENTCFHIRRIMVDDGLFKNASGEKVYTILGEVAPSGAGMVWLERQFENPDENVCFSIRSFTENKPGPGGRLYKYVREVNTWDYVNEGGIRSANKFDCPSLEALDSYEFGDEMDLRKMITGMRASVGPDGVSNESAADSIDSLNRLILSVKDTSVSVPVSARW